MAARPQIETLQGVPEWATNWQPRFEQLGQLQRAEFFKGLNQFAIDVFSSHSMFSSDRNLLGPDRTATVLQAVNSSDFSSVDPYGEESAYRDLLKSAQKKESLKRDIIRLFIVKGNELGLDNQERTVVLGFCDLADTLDRIGDRWRNDLIWSETGRKI